jgi:hypothetical protein
MARRSARFAASWAATRRAWRRNAWMNVANPELDGPLAFGA